MPQQTVRVLEADRIALGAIDPAAFETAVFPTGDVDALDLLSAAFADGLARRVRIVAGERRWIRNITSQRLRNDPSWGCQLILALDEGREPPSPPSLVGTNQPAIAWMRPIDSRDTPALNGPDPPTSSKRTAQNPHHAFFTHGAALPPPVAGPFVYIFNHIPRTGGVSIGAFIESIFPVVRDYPSGPTDADLAAWRDTPIDLENLPDGTAVAGHYNAPGARLHERYPAAMASPRYRLITFLREPVTWLRSCLEYFCPDGASLDTTADEFANAFAHAFEVPTLSPEAALDRYWMVGTTEHAQDCCDRFAAAMGVPPRPLARLNAAPARHDIAALSRAIRRYLETSPHDSLLYAQACRRVERTLAVGLAVS